MVHSKTNSSCPSLKARRPCSHRSYPSRLRAEIILYMNIYVFRIDLSLYYAARFTLTLEDNCCN